MKFETFIQVIVAILVILAFMLLGGAIVAIMWNFAIASTFNLPELSLEKGVAILILVRVLVSGFNLNFKD